MSRTERVTGTQYTVKVSAYMVNVIFEFESDDMTRRTNTAFPSPLQRRQKEPSPPPTRLSQLNYAMLKEGALRKKLQEIGIPNWGGKDLLKRRHIEWLNIHNSNCDADESVRKSKRQLLKELDEWEHTQGGRAESKESKLMKKDFDGRGYAKANKSEFDDLIARARQKRAAPKAEAEKQENGVGQQESDESRREEGSVSQPQSLTNPDPQLLQEPHKINERTFAVAKLKSPEANHTESHASKLSHEASTNTPQEGSLGNQALVAHDVFLETQ